MKVEEKELELLQLKARCFDEVAGKYDALRANAGFYSQNWVELAEVIEAAMARVKKAS